MLTLTNLAGAKPSALYSKLEVTINLYLKLRITISPYSKLKKNHEPILGT